MSTVGQWAHQHDALLLVGLVLGASLGGIAHLRRRSARLGAAWLVAAAVGAGAAYAVRTPAASLSEHVAADATPADPTPRPAYEEPAVASAEDIRAVLGRGGKPTLVEVYADYGIS